MTINSEQIQELKDNKVSDPYYLVECCNCGEMYPSNKLSGGWQIADTGDYGDCYCPHCDASEDYEDLGNSAAEAWNYQQKQIDALLAERDADKALIAEQAKRIAELEAMTVSLKLPPNAPENLASVLDGYEKWLVATTFRDTWNACLAEVTRVNAAGIILVVEE